MFCLHWTQLYQGWRWGFWSTQSFKDPSPFQPVALSSPRTCDSLAVPSVSGQKLVLGGRGVPPVGSIAQTWSWWISLLFSSHWPEFCYVDPPNWKAEVWPCSMTIRKKIDFGGHVLTSTISELVGPGGTWDGAVRYMVSKLKRPEWVPSLPNSPLPLHSSTLEWSWCSLSQGSTDWSKGRLGGARTRWVWDRVTTKLEAKASVTIYFINSFTHLLHTFLLRTNMYQAPTFKNIHLFSLIWLHWISVVACVMSFPDQGLNPGSLN